MFFFFLQTTSQLHQNWLHATLIPYIIFLFKVNNENTRTMYSLFKANDKDTGTTLLTLFCYRYCYLWTDFKHYTDVFLVNFEQTNVSWDKIRKGFVYFLYFVVCSFLLFLWRFASWFFQLESRKKRGWQSYFPNVLFDYLLK